MRPRRRRGFGRKRSLHNASVVQRQLSAECPTDPARLMRGYQTKRFPRRCAARGYIRRLANPIPQHTTANPNGYVHHGTQYGSRGEQRTNKKRIYEQTYERKHRYAHDERRDDINGSTRIGQADGPPRQRREDQRKADRLHRRGRFAGLRRHSYGNRDDGAVPRADARIQRHHIDGPIGSPPSTCCPWRQPCRSVPS